MRRLFRKRRGLECSSEEEMTIRSEDVSRDRISDDRTRRCSNHEQLHLLASPARLVPNQRVKVWSCTAYLAISLDQWAAIGLNLLGL